MASNDVNTQNDLKQRVLSESEVLQLGKDLAYILQKRAAPHGGICPESIAFGKNGAYLREKKAAVGPFTAPELLHGGKATAAADVYSLSMVMFWLLNDKSTAGNEPKRGSQSLKMVILKGCAYDPAQRYRNAAELLAALGRVPAAAGTPAQQSEMTSAPKSNDSGFFHIFRPHLITLSILAILVLLSDMRSGSGDLRLTPTPTPRPTLPPYLVESSQRSMEALIQQQKEERERTEEIGDWADWLSDDTPQCGPDLVDCPIIEDSNSGTDIVVGRHKSKAGVPYENSAKYWVSDVYGLTNVEYTLYALNGQYKELSGMIALAEESSYRASVEFVFYDGNGEELYRSSYISGSETEEFSFSVKGVEELHVECVTYETCDCFGIISAVLYK